MRTGNINFLSMSRFRDVVLPFEKEFVTNSFCLFFRIRIHVFLLFFLFWHRF